MADQKIFAGPRVRRIRHQLELTQTAMAAELGISPSYLNLIERNQRPLTVQIILKLASTFKINLDEFQGDSDTLLAQLREVFADPLLATELPGDQELIETADAAPNVALSILKLHRALRESQARLSDLSDMLAEEGRTTAMAGARLPADEVRDTLEKRANHFDRIEAEAEAFVEEIKPGDDLAGALKTWLAREHGIAVRILPISAMAHLRRRYDRHSNRLFISERLSPHDQMREIAKEAALMRMRETIKAEIEALKLSSDEARRIVRFELARYAAHALMMPYQAFLTACQKVRYDIDLVRSRFNVSFEQAANRLTMLRRHGASGIPFFMMEIDQAGNRFRRAGAKGYPQARFGGSCPKLPVHEAFNQPSHILVEALEMPDGSEFLVICRTIIGLQGGFGERPRRTALLLGCDLKYRDEVVYGQLLRGRPDADGRLPTIPVGPACRICERTDCLARAEPPITRPLGLDDMAGGLSAFDFV